MASMSLPSFCRTAKCRLVRLGTEDGIDMKPILNSLDDRRAHVLNLHGIYKAQLMTIHLFAKAAGRKEFEAMTHLASAQGLGIRCCTGTPDESQEGALAL